MKHQTYIRTLVAVSSAVILAGSGYALGNTTLCGVVGLNSSIIGASQTGSVFVTQASALSAVPTSGFGQTAAKTAIVTALTTGARWKPRPTPTPTPTPVPTDLTTVTIGNQVLVPQAKRFGLNVGERSAWGASQFLKNLVDNPGFEPGEYGTVALTDSGTSGNRVYQAFWNTSWNNDDYGIGQPTGFWNGADYEFVFGPAKGRAGKVSSFDLSTSRYMFTLDTSSPNPQLWDVMFVRNQLPGLANWRFMDTVAGDTTTTRPGSPGQQSMHLFSPGNDWEPPYVFYMDSFYRDGDTTAGKLISIRGNYRLEFWAKGKTNSSLMEIAFFRNGQALFIDEYINLTTSWQHYQFDVYVPPGTDPIGPYGPNDPHYILTLGVYIGNAGDEVWMDDMALFCTDDTNPTVFTDTFVNRLKELNPGVLRDWSNQLGSSLDNQLAEPWARKTQGFSPADRTASQYSYSLHEFLALCKEVGAEPWYVIPPTFTKQELTNLVQYLAGPADGAHPYADKRNALGQLAPWASVFPTIHLEFGNEMWGSASGGDPFMGESVCGGTHLGVIAHDRFGVMKAAPFFSALKFDLIIGGQSGFPGRQAEIEANSSNHNHLALAPYFGTLETYANDSEIYYPLFTTPFHEVKSGYFRESKNYVDAGGHGTGLSIYEINYHTTDGVVPLSIRNDFLTNAAGAISLPLNMLVYQRDFGIKDQCAFSALGYSFMMDNGEYARVWGMLRDLNVTGRKRPTWLGVEAVNKAVFGDMVATTQSGTNPKWTQQPINAIGEATTMAYVQSFAFRNGKTRSVVLFNLHLTETQNVQLTLSAAPVGAATMYKIATTSIHDNNEDAEKVKIVKSTLSTFSQNYKISLAPHSVHVLTWTSSI